MSELDTLRQEVETLRREKADAEMILDMTADHADEITAELEAARQAAEAANTSKSAFLANVSHELRTPLTSVLGFAKIIQRELDRHIFPNVNYDPTSRSGRKVARAIDGVREDLGIIVAEGERLTAMINNVLDLAKIEAGRVDWHEVPIRMSELVDRAVAATSSLFAEKAVEMRVEVSADLPILIGDSDKLLQVLINLISNAVKFTPAGSVTIHVDHRNATIQTQIIDTGIGIAPEDQANVFEKFRQVGNTLTDKPTGTGLGLPICREIIEYHGGRIWVESAVGVGSTFVFTIPTNAGKAQVASN